MKKAVRFEKASIKSKIKLLSISQLPRLSNNGWGVFAGLIHLL